MYDCIIMRLSMWPSSLRSPSMMVSRCLSMGACPFSWKRSRTKSNISALFSSEMMDSGRFGSSRLVTDMTPALGGKYPMELSCP
jgi:hypothetical protein